MHTDNNQRFVGKVLTRLEIVDSTNDYAKRQLSKTKPLEGTAIIAAFQEKGRGQFGNHWQSQHGKNLLLSVIFYPGFLEPAEIFLLNKAVSLAVKEAVAYYAGENVFIKWPNDIYYSDKKVAGILIETSLSGNKVTDAVVGIGLNVNQTDFNPELENPSSLKMILSKELDLQIVADKLFAFLEKRYLQLNRGEIAEVENDYNQSLHLLNVLSTFQTMNGNVEGKIIGVNEKGQLMLETESGLRLFNHKEISLLKANR